MDKREGYTTRLTAPDDEKLISMVTTGGYFNWRKFRAVPSQIHVMSERHLYTLCDTTQTLTKFMLKSGESQWKEFNQ